MSRLARRFIVIPVLLILSACSSVHAQMIADQIANSYLSIGSYQGLIVERGVLPKNRNARLVSKVVYQSAWKIRSEVIEPASLKGTLFIYDGATIILWWPKDLFGIRIRGATPPTAQQVRRIIRGNTRWSMKSYAFSFLGNRTVARRRATRWKVFPTVKRPYFFPYESLMDKRFSMPLKLVVRDRPERVWYSMEFKKIKFGVDLPQDTFSFTFPPNAVVFDWDLGIQGQPLAVIQRQMNFKVLQPGRLPWGHQVRKIIKSRHCLPMAALLMDKDGRWLSLTEMRSIGPSLEIRSGVPIRVGKLRGYISFMGPFAMVSWKKGNTNLFLVGNMPYPELIAIAASAR